MGLANLADVDSAVGAEEHWDRVRQTLQRVFRQQARAARRLVDEVRERFSNAEPLERLLILHTSPLHLAADILGRQISDQEDAAYQRLFPSG